MKESNRKSCNVFLKAEDEILMSVCILALKAVEVEGTAPKNVLYS